MKMFLNMLKGGFMEERKCLTVLHHAIDENSSCEIKCRFSANYSTFCEKEEGVYLQFDIVMRVPCKILSLCKIEWGGGFRQGTCIKVISLRI